MKLGGLGRLGLIACCALPVSACGVFLGSAPPEPMSHTQAKSAARLAQLDFGRDALFASCLAPACPTRTPKTLTRETPGLPSPQRPTERTAALVPIASVAPAPAAIEPAPKRQIAHVVTVPFAFGSSRLENAAQARLDSALANIGAAVSVTITGRTDSTGPAAINEALALARADAVRDYLRKTHPALAPALKVEAQGACCFVASNDTLAGRAQNRRVEVVFQASEGQRP